MAYSALSRKGDAGPYDLTLCLTSEDCKLLLPAFEKRLKEAEKKFEKYNDIHQGGEATEKQKDLMVKYEDEMDTMRVVVHVAKELIK